MNDHFNELTPAEAERLAILLEELGEAQQAIGKILRHGYESGIMYIGTTNRIKLECELGDVYSAVISLCDNCDLRKDVIHDAAQNKMNKIQKYLHHG